MQFRSLDFWKLAKAAKKGDLRHKFTYGLYKLQIVLKCAHSLANAISATYGNVYTFRGQESACKMIRTPAQAGKCADHLLAKRRWATEVLAVTRRRLQSCRLRSPGARALRGYPCQVGKKEKPKETTDTCLFVCVGVRVFVGGGVLYFNTWVCPHVWVNNLLVFVGRFMASSIQKYRGTWHSPLLCQFFPVLKVIP